MDFIKKNITLLIGLAIPVLMIILVAGSVYLPGLFIKPTYNFVYLSGDPYYFNNQYQYSVTDGKLEREEVETPNAPRPVRPVQKQNQRLYLHDVASNESKEITYEEAQELTLNTSPLSPDGFEIVQGSGGGGFFPFFYSGNDYNTRYLNGHNVSKKLNIQKAGSYYNDFHFLGWIQ